jgi:hypothetical protein
MRASDAKKIMEDDSITIILPSKVVADILTEIQLRAIRGDDSLSVDLYKHGPKVEDLVRKELESLGYYTCHNNRGGTNIFWDRKH